MQRIAILCVEDEPEVREALVRDLHPFTSHVRIEPAEDVEDAKQALAECERDGEHVGLILCDHVLPGQTGVDFLIALNQDPATASIRKVLITGQAGLEDTVRAVNEANLDHYIAKPWSVDDLQQIVRDQLTHFVLDRYDDLLPFVSFLDGPRLLDAVRQRQSDK